MLGEKLERIRKEKGWSRKKLSEAAGVTEVSIYNFEKGKNKPTGVTLAKIARALEIDFEELYKSI